MWRYAQFAVTISGAAKMKKASKILTLILIAVLVLSVFAGCSLVGRNVGEYRNVTAFSVGKQDVTVGKLLDTFNSYYNNYYYYISAGYLDASQLLDMVISSIVQQNLQIDDYVETHSALNEAQLTPLQKTIRNADRLTADEFAYAVKYINYSTFSALDQYADQNLTNKYDLGAAETEDTSRDFTEYDNWKGAASYAEYVYNQNFQNEDADEYFEKYYPADMDVEGDINLDGYVYDLDDATQREFAQKRVDEFNDRRNDKDGKELTVEEYVEVLSDVKKQYEETVSTNYGISLGAFLDQQLAEMVGSCILAKWSYQYYKDLESDEDFVAKLNEQFANNKAAQIADFNINDNFDSFITSLSSDSNIYEIPADKENDYVFVKNILIPFSAAQTALLTNLQNTQGSTETPAYENLRKVLASEIFAQYFDSDKYDAETESAYFAKETWFEDKKKEDDDDSLWKTKANVFATDASGNLIVNADGVLGQFLNADGTVTPIDGKTEAETVVELMKRFNTDTAQHTAAFDYVVYVGDDWEDYNHSWVKEFYTAVNEDLVRGNKQYTLCISTYGVHIIYLSGHLADKKFDSFDISNIGDTSSASYKLYKSYFDSQMSVKTQEAFEALEKSVLVDKDYKEYIKFSDGFKIFLKDNDFDFDFDDFIESLKAEL